MHLYFQLYGLLFLHYFKMCLYQTVLIFPDGFATRSTSCAAFPNQGPRFLYSPSSCVSFTGFTKWNFLGGSISNTQCERPRGSTDSWVPSTHTVSCAVICTVCVCGVLWPQSDSEGTRARGDTPDIEEPEPTAAESDYESNYNYLRASPHNTHHTPPSSSLRFFPVTKDRRDETGARSLHSICKSPPKGCLEASTVQRMTAGRLKAYITSGQVLECCSVMKKWKKNTPQQHGTFNIVRRLEKNPGTKIKGAVCN